MFWQNSDNHIRYGSRDWRRKWDCAVKLSSALGWGGGGGWIGLAQTAEKWAVLSSNLPTQGRYGSLFLIIFTQMYKIYVKSFIYLFSWGQRGSYELVLYLGNYE
jgi:hypothetical protein